MLLQFDVVTVVVVRVCLKYPGQVRSSHGHEGLQSLGQSYTYGV